MPPNDALMLRYDLHCHSTWSDGLLAPEALVARAAANGVDVLALTDHDELGGLEAAAAAAARHGIALVYGAEVSVSWQHRTIHVVGLGVDPANAELAAGLQAVRAGRGARARRIAEALGEAGIRGAYEGALRYVTHPQLVTRTHFARYLVEAGYVNEVKDVFKRYLVPGRPGYVQHAWAPLGDAIGWIHAAGGQAVLAHAGRYKLTSTGLRGLLHDFRAAGGDAIEVLSPSHTAAQQAELATLARVYDLLASAGSDFHGPGESALDIGALGPLPAGTTPVWASW
jgi:predicted metal-dependent phosphoesterase TrpH